MASITIRNLDDRLKARLRIQAAHHGRSMEDEVRDILRIALGGKQPKTKDLATSIRARVAEFGGVDLKLPPREPIREPPRFEE